MKNLYIFSFIVLNYSFAYSGFDNFDNKFNDQEALFKIGNELQEFPNKPIIEYPLPQETYEYMYEQHKNAFITSKDFITFLKNRSHFNENETNKQWQLIQVLASNHNNKNLTPLTKPMAKFARSTVDLYYHQLTSELQLHPREIPLTKFEQNYKFKLEQIDLLEYFYITENINITGKNHYRSVVLKKWARFLLKKIAKK